MLFYAQQARKKLLQGNVVRYAPFKVVQNQSN